MKKNKKNKKENKNYRLCHDTSEGPIVALLGIVPPGRRTTRAMRRYSAIDAMRHD